MQFRRYKMGTEDEAEESITIPVDVGIAKMLQDAYNEQIDILMLELPYIARDMDLIEQCMKELECRIQVHRIAYETAVEILHYVIDKVAREIWSEFESRIRRLEAQSKDIM